MAELYKIARELDIPGYYRLRKQELIYEIRKTRLEKEGLMYA
ncbi:MAG: Rho termination factor N-terminal domain-containing protein, partial [Firmicutes bacterium]|nr:Rho termination factor N-terminal domain-containing protein [Bacillota bacterium]